MILRAEPRIDLTYCMNVHPGRSWGDQKRAVEEAAAGIRDRVSPGERFGLGLRISNAASLELDSEGAREEVGRFLEESGFYAFTINGFPFDYFHGKKVKEKVYEPDWRTEERRFYTCRLAEFLAGVLPEGVSGSISTVPGSYKSWIRDEDDRRGMVLNLVEAVLVLDRILEESGREIHLGLEPEPDCFLETTGETIDFLRDWVFGKGGEIVASRRGISRERAEAVLRRHLGICFDTCHLALQFEDLAESWRRFSAAGIRISKVQLSNALEVGVEGLGRLKEFVEPVYLHQVKGEMKGGGVAGWPDLPPALSELCGNGDGFERFRVHFHVPLFWEGDGELRTTQPALTPEFFRLLGRSEPVHLEIETYTYDVLPESVRSGSLVESVAAEYRWVLDRWGRD